MHITCIEYMCVRGYAEYVRRCSETVVSTPSCANFDAKTSEIHTQTQPEQHETDTAYSPSATPFIRFVFLIVRFVGGTVPPRASRLLPSSVMSAARPVATTAGRPTTGSAATGGGSSASPAAAAANANRLSLKKAMGTTKVATAGQTPTHILVYSSHVRLRVSLNRLVS